jgi:geranylgeranyl transferase type-2 subunit alpha
MITMTLPCIISSSFLSALTLCMQIYTIWNFRKEALSSIFEAAATSTSSSPDDKQEVSEHLTAAKKASDGELALTQACLTENPKSYSTWHHRKWVVAKGLCDLQVELRLVTRALDEDSRNFHAWSYRKLIVALMKRGDDQELAYSEEKIAQDFSNYSAFHYRTTLLPREEERGEGRAAEGRGLISASVLDEEFDMVHQAFATDCKDQSPWMYYRWLLGQCQAHLEANQKGGLKGSEEEARLYLDSVYEREMRRMREDHLGAEPDAKWPLLTLAVLSEGLHRLQMTQEGRGEVQEGLGQDAGVCPEARKIYERLLVLDPMRSGFYRDALEGKASLLIAS